MLFPEPSMRSSDDVKMAPPVYGQVDSIESFGSVDGPGLRYIVFLKGCPLRCLYCHNPETWGSDKAKRQTAEETLRSALRYRPYWKGGGGITVSGGEPMLQMEFVTDLFRRAKAENVSTCIDTSGSVFSREADKLKAVDELLEVTDLLLLDIKHIDGEKHKALTGLDNANILDFARYLADKERPVWIRHVLVPGINDDEESLRRTGEFVATLGNVQRFEVLPYHRMAIHKYEDLGIKYRIPDIPEPDSESVARANRILNTEAYQGYKNS